MDAVSAPVMLTAGILLAAFLFRILRIPLRRMLKLLLNAAIGYIGLLIFNFFGGFLGLQIATNWITILVTGILGLPGVILLLLCQYCL